MRHDLFHVQRVMTLLEAHGIITWLFGGWAEELHCLAMPRAHRDVDLLYPAVSFALVDQFLRLGKVEEIAAKHFPHKRAFTCDGVLTEIILVEPDFSTTFWEKRRFKWPDDTFDLRRCGIRVASPAALVGYRAAHPSLHDHERHT